MTEPQETPNYIDKAAAALQTRVSRIKGRPTKSPDELLRIYALLLFAKGRAVTLENLHDAWAVWRTQTQPTHCDLVPFDELSEDTQQHDLPYVQAIHELATELGTADVLSDTYRWQVQEARDCLATWDLAREGNPGIDRERVLADQLRAVLGIVDELAPREADPDA